MAQQYWFEVTVSFTCLNPKRGKLSSEKMFINSSTQDPNKINTTINTQSVKCRFCGMVPPDGTQISVKVLPTTLDQAKASGFDPAPGSGI